MNWKPVLLIATTALLLSACRTPNYGEALNKTEEIKEETTATSTEIVSFNGYVAEITEDNVIKVRVPKAGQLIQSGFDVNEDAIIPIVLGAIDLPIQSMPFSNEVNAIVQGLLPIGNEIQIDVPADTISLEQSILEGIVYFDKSDKQNSIQSVLLENGLALLDSKTNLSQDNLDMFNNLQTLAQNGELGIWAVDGLITLSQQAEAEFTKIAAFSDQQLKGIIEEFKARGWSVKDILNDYGFSTE